MRGYESSGERSVSLWGRHVQVARFPPSLDVLPAALVRAAKLGDVERIQELLRSEFDCNAAPQNRSTALITAVAAGQFRSVYALLADKRVDVNKADRWGRHPITVSFFPVESNAKN